MENNYKFERADLRISSRYNFVISPLDFSILRKVLKELNYNVMKPPIPQQFVPGGIIDIDGQIATRNGVAITSNIDKQVLTISSNEEDELLTSFSELEKSLSIEIGLELKDNVHFYETILHFAIKTGNNPIQTFSNLSNDYPFHKEMSNIFNIPVAPLSYRISTKEIPINSRNWFEYTIQPLSSNATTYYHVSLIFRNIERNIVVDIIKRSKEIITSTLKLLETGNIKHNL